MRKIKLIDGGEVKYTGPEGQSLIIQAEHSQDGGWTLSVKIPGMIEGSFNPTEQIELPPRPSYPGVQRLKTVLWQQANLDPIEPYDWGKRS